MSTHKENPGEIDTKKYKINYLPLILILVVTIPTIFLWVYLAVGPSFIDRFDFTKTGSIGDTIGGLTAPIIGLAGAILVYVSFQAQLKANKMQFDALIEERIRFENEHFYQYHSDLFRSIKKSFEEIEFIIYKDDDEKYLTFKGSYAILELQFQIINLKNFINWKRTKIY